LYVGNADADADVDADVDEDAILLYKEQMK
jgi:hypothetical protein